MQKNKPEGAGHRRRAAPAAAASPAPAKAKSAAKGRSARAGAAAQQAQAQPAAEGAAPVRIIKKYPNRRLYDTSASAYITMADVRELVMQRAAFVVRDAKTSEDLTRSILLQIILEEEAGGAPMFTEQVLANIIRFYGHAMQGFMGSYLEKNVQNLMELQTKLAEQSKGLSPEMWTQMMSQQAPLMQGVMGSYMEQSKQLFAQMLSNFGLKR